MVADLVVAGVGGAMILASSAKVHLAAHSTGVCLCACFNRFHFFALLALE